MHASRVLCLGLICLGCAVFGQDKPATPAPPADSVPVVSSKKTPRPISLEEAIQMALRTNLDIQIERVNPRISQLNLYGAYAGWEPTFDLTYQHSDDSRPLGPVDLGGGVIVPNTSSESDGDALSAGIRGVAPTGLSYDIGSDIFRREQFGIESDLDYSGNATLSLRQPILRNLIIDNTRYQIRLGKKTLQISEQILAYQIMSVINQVQQAYYDLIFSRENVSVQENALDLAEQLLADNRVRVEVGQLAELDEKQSESQARLRQADVIEARSLREQQENLLKRLITDNFVSMMNVALEPVDKLSPPVPQTFDVTESLRAGLMNRADLKQLRIDLERRDITLKFNKTQRLPVLDLVGSYGHNALDGTFRTTLKDFKRGDNPSYTYGAVLSVPLGNRAANTRYRISKEEKAQALLQYKRLEQEIQSQILNAIEQARSAMQRVEATREAALYAEQARQAEEKKLENGKSTSFNVLQFQNDETSARFAHLRARADYYKAIANLEFLEGKTLESNGIILEESSKK